MLGAVEVLTAASDAPDRARAKLHKAIGLAMIAVLDQADDADIAPALVAQAETAVVQLKRARALSESCGVQERYGTAGAAHQARGRFRLKSIPRSTAARGILANPFA